MLRRIKESMVDKRSEEKRSEEKRRDEKRREQKIRIEQSRADLAHVLEAIFLFLPYSSSFYKPFIGQ